MGAKTMIILALTAQAMGYVLPETTCTSKAAVPAPTYVPSDLVPTYVPQNNWNNNWNGVWNNNWNGGWNNWTPQSVPTTTPCTKPTTTTTCSQTTPTSNVYPTNAGSYPSSSKKTGVSIIAMFVGVLAVVLV